MADFNDVDLNLLRVFQAVLEERSLTRAGQRIGLSQPAISYSLGRLRTMFDDPLFVRTPDGMLPTSMAEQLAGPISVAIGAIREALGHGEKFDPATSHREFRLAMSDIGEQFFLPLIFERLQDIAPNVRVAAELVPVSEVEERLRLGQLDFAIGNVPSLKPVTQYAVLFREHYACMTRKRPGLPDGTLTREQFLEMSHVAVASTDASHLAIEDALRAAGMRRRIALRVPHFTVIPQILRRTDLMVTTPRGVANVLNEEGRFTIYPMPVPAPEFESTMHWHASFENDYGSRWFRQLLLDTLHSPTEPVRQ